MENTRAMIGAAIFIGMILFSNLILYGVVRSFTRDSSSHTGLFKAMQGLTQDTKQKDTSYDELRKRVDELKEKVE